VLPQDRNALIYGGAGSIGGRSPAPSRAREHGSSSPVARKPRASNLIAHPYTHGVPLAEMDVEDVMAPVETAARSTFITARAAARHMIPRRSGVILAFGGPGDRSGPMRDYYLGGTQVAFDAVEAIRRQLAVELGPHGIAVVTLASGGVPETLPEGFQGRRQIVESRSRHRPSRAGPRRSKTWATRPSSQPRIGDAA
jgi:NAD(P)-dependent dehydrogenase (short-subunit alcohol dehydrogenase family)